jgi:hypothetical protein
VDKYLHNTHSRIRMHVLTHTLTVPRQRYSSGAIYKGSWENNQRHGYGEMFDPTSNVPRRGKWRHGVLSMNLLRTKEFWRRVKEVAEVAEYKASQAEEAARAAKSQAERAESTREHALDVQARARYVFF